MFRSLLIANRGEIAVRIIRTCRRIGIRTIAVYSDADRKALHVREADSAVYIGGTPARESYLNADAIMKAAFASGAEAIHPGYGFLSEKPILPELCAKAGLVFVGPSADRITAMGSKIAAKAIAATAGVASVPGYSGEDQSDKRLIEEANRIGFPVMIKASAGGGGRGMRAIHDAEDLPEALSLARQEAEAAFGDPSLLLEKLLLRPRHLEVQIAGDRHGNIIHLFERDCSVQRKNQKVIEEAPAPNLDDAIRAKLFDRALRLARAIRYDNLGTVEFILDEGETEPWFLEMNTRLQVEHPVTEAITGLDLVEWQIRIAAGEPLPLQQDAVKATGHAIEARITAERADLDFRPGSEQVLDFFIPPGVRVDSAIAAGSIVTPHYDSLLAKVIAHGANREESRQHLAASLRSFSIFGPATTTAFLADALDHFLFRDGLATTSFIADAFQGGWQPKKQHHMLAMAAALALWGGNFSSGPGQHSAWSTLAGFRILAFAGAPSVSHFLIDEDTQPTIKASLIVFEHGTFALRSSGVDIQFKFSRNGLAFDLEFERRFYQGRCAIGHNVVHIWLAGETYSFAVLLEADGTAETKDRDGDRSIITAAMPGVIAEIKVSEGQNVLAGDTVAVLESMKLFLPVQAEVSGTIAEIACAKGEAVIKGKKLMRIVS